MAQFRLMRERPTLEAQRAPSERAPKILVTGAAREQVEGRPDVRDVGSGGDSPGEASTLAR